jgi:autotransporter-associated beta strand protein
MRKSLLRGSYIAAITFLQALTAIGQTVVGPAEVLPVTSSTAENFILNGGTLEPTNVTLSGTIELQNHSHIIRPQNPLVSDIRGNLFEPSTGPTMLTGPISGAGDLEIGNLSRDQIFISGDSVYDGHTYITSGTVRVNSANALGSTLSGTTIQEGLLDVRVQTQEPFRVEGGRLEFNVSGFEPNGPLTIAGGKVVLPSRNDYLVPVIVDGEQGEISFGSSQFVPWIGGSTGVGNLRISGRVSVDAPLTHQGDVTVNGAILNAVNSYAGRTFLAADYTIDRDDVFGNSTTPIEIVGGDVVATVLPNGNRGFALRQGSLHIQIGNAPISAPIVIGGPTNPVLTGDNTYNGPVELAGATFDRATIRGGVFNGVISGYADRLTLIGDTPIQLNADSTYQARTLSGHEGTVEVNAPRALGDVEQGTRVSVGEFQFNANTNEPVVINGRGSIYLNAQQARFPRFADLESSELDRRHTVEVNVSSTYGERVEVAEGTLKINANASLGSLAVRKNGAVQVADGKTLVLGQEELVFEEGLIDGRILGPATLRKTTTARGEIQHLAGFDGDIVIERGALEAFSSDALGTAAGITHVAERDAVLRLRASGFDPPLVIQEDIFLNNSTGIDHTGGLYLSQLCCNTPTIRLNGRLDLGSVGSIVGTPSSSSTADNVTLEVVGPVSGGSLTTLGRRLRMILMGGDHSYTGATNIREGTIELASNGSLKATSAIVLHEGPESFDGTLLLDNSQLQQSDRIPDAVPIDFRGGQLQATGGTDESLGPLDFIEGLSRIDLSGSFNDNQSSRLLHVASINRQVGATARLFSTGNGQLDAADSPSLSGDILPWLVVRDSFSPSTFDSFGTVVNGRVRGLSASSYVTGISASTSTDNVVVSSSNEMLNADKTVNSLTFGISHSPLNLGGHELKVASGGIILGNGGRLENGTILPGETSELIFYGRGAVSADITDGESGAASVTYAEGSTGLILSGNNTYTGTTYVNEGAAYLATASALPDNGNLVIVGGDLQIGYVATGAKHLKNVRIAGHGALTQQFTGQRGQGIFSFDQIVLEEGELVPGQLVGSGEIIKRTIGLANISADQRSTYNGNVIVEDGRLNSSGLSQAKYIVRGGSLQLAGGGNSITLDGGTLYLSSPLSGNIDVLSASAISTDSQATTRFRAEHSGQLSGSGKLTLTSEVRFQKIRHEVTFSNNSPNYTGDVAIDSVLVVADQPQSLGTGSITILPGGKLRFGGRSLSSELPSFDFSNDIDLRGGELFGSDNDRQPRQLLGELRVSDHSMIGEMNVIGNTYLADGARLTTFREGLLRFLGDIQVGGHAEIEYGLQEIGTNSAGTRGALQLLGTISSAAPVSVLNLIDRGLDEAVIDVTLHAEAGHSLTLLKDGQPLEVSLSGEGNGLAGNGVLANDFVLTSGAAISPGDSPGLLTIDGNASLAIESRFIVELGGTLRGGQYDALDVLGNVVLENALLELSLIDNFTPAQDDEFVILQAANINGTFSNAAKSFRVDDILFDVEYRSDQVVLANAVMVPEPSASALAIGAILVVAVLAQRNYSKT